MLAQALLSGSVCKNVILKEYIKTETNPSYLWAMDDNYNGYVADDDFTGVDGDPPNAYLWEDPYSVYSTIVYSAMIDNNSLLLTINPINQDAGDNVKVNAKYNLGGDFDVEIEFSDLVTQNHYAAGLSFAIFFSNGHYFYVKADYNSGNVFSIRFMDGTDNDTIIPRVEGFGKLGLTRVGDTCTARYQDGNSTWVEQDYIMPGIDVGNLALTLYDHESGGVTSGKYDNYKVNSGTPIWPVIEEIAENHGETINEPIAQQPPLTAYSLPTDKSFLINGSTQAIDTNLTVSSQASRTVLMTFEMTDFPEPQLLFSDGDYEGLTKRLHLGINTDYWAWIVSDGVEGYGDSDVHPHNLVVGEKYIVAYVIDVHDISIYVNGELSANFGIPTDTAPAAGVGDLMIGKDGSADLFYGNFYVDLFVVYDEALSLTDIRASAGIFLTGNVCGAPPVDDDYDGYVMFLGPEAYFRLGDLPSTEVFVYEPFSGSDGDPLPTGFTLSQGNATAEILSNKLRVVCDTATDNLWTWVTCDTLQDGDFSAEVTAGVPGVFASYAFCLEMRVGDTYFARAVITPTNGVNGYRSFVDSYETIGQYETATLEWGGFILRRVGSVISAMVGFEAPPSGTLWSKDIAECEGTATIRLGVYNQTTPADYTDFWDFYINSVPAEIAVEEINGNDGTYKNSPLVSTEGLLSNDLNGSLSLVPSAAYVSLPGAITANIGTAFTFTALMRFDTIPANGLVYKFGDFYSDIQIWSGQLIFNVSSYSYGAASVNHIIVEGETIHLTVTVEPLGYPNGDLNMYINGAHESNDACYELNKNNNLVIDTIGDISGTETTFTIDEYALFNKILTLPEIENLANIALGR